MKGLRIQKVTKTFTFGAAVATADNQLIGKEGWILSMIITIPAFTNNVIPTVTIVDSDSVVSWIASAGGKVDIPTNGSNYVGCRLSGVPGGSGGSVTVTMYIGVLEG